MCDLDLSISKEVVKPDGKNDFRSKKQRVLRGDIFIGMVLEGKVVCFNKKSPRIMRGDF